MSALRIGVLAAVGSFFLLNASAAHAQTGCGQRDAAITDEVNKLVRDIESGAQRITSVDSFLAALPEPIRQSMIFVGDSRSLQESSVTNPRVLLKSPNSDVILSFNTDPSHRGYDAIEMTVWNAATAKVEMAEIRFPEDTRDATLRASGRATVARNPQKCVVCHSESRSWLFDPYRIWAGHIPWSEDALNRDSIEVEWYKKFLNDVTSGQPRMRHLRPMETAAEIDAALASTGRYQIKSPRGETTQPNNTPGLDLSHQVLIYNGCRVANELAARPDWDRIKYAVAGATTGCANPSSFLDDAGNKNARDFFEERGTGLGADSKFNYEALLADTQRRQNSTTNDREGRQTWFFEKYAGGAAVAKREMDAAVAALSNNGGGGRSPGSRIEAFENSGRENTASRYLLQPLGIDVQNWSMAVDKETYSHVQFFDEIGRAKPIQDVLRAAGGDCSRLAALSREALRGTPVRPPREDAAGFCSPAELEAQARDLARNLTPVVMRGNAALIFPRCSGCHTSGAGGAPRLPFGDMNALEARIKSTKGTVGDFGERVWGRVSRYPESTGAMPARGQHLTNEEKVAMRAWFDSISP